MKKLIVCFLSLLLCTSLFAQKNVIKFGLEGLLVGAVNAKYERVLTEDIAVQLDFSLKPESDLPFGLNLSNVINKDIDIEAVNFSARSIKPSVKFYTGQKAAPRGLYLAPMLNFSNAKLVYEDTFMDKDVNISLINRTFGVGLQVGAQWLVSDRFSIDWYFLGATVSGHNIALTAESDLLDLEIPEILEDVIDVWGEVPVLGDKLGVIIEDGKAGFSTRYFFPTLRTGISLGVAF